MTRSISFRHVGPLLATILWLGCGGSGAPTYDFRGGAGGTSGPAETGGAPALVGTGGAAGFVATGGRSGLGGSMCSPGGFGGLTGTGGRSGVVTSTEFPPQLGTTSSQDQAPPAISGGTLLVLSGGKTAVAADPDRDVVYVVDLPSRTVTQTIVLQAGDEPGRLVQDAAGRVHVALRRGGAIATCDPTTGTIVSRRAVCAAPRGVAYDPATDRLHVACHDGQLVSLPAAGGDPVRHLKLDDDLRDVLVDGDTLLVTRFRSAELLTVASDGTVTGRVQPPRFNSTQAHSGSMFTPSVAWRALPAPGGGTLVLHQRGMTDPVVPTAGGYGGPSPCDTIVHGCISRIDRDGTTRSGPALASLVLAVDMAVSPDGKQVAVVAAGNATNSDLALSGTAPALTRVFLTDLDSATDPKIGCSMDGTHAPCLRQGRMVGPTPSATGGAVGSLGTGGSSVGAGGSVGTGGAGGRAFVGGSAGAVGTTPVVCPAPPPGVPVTVGQPIAVAFDGSGALVVQSREPAALALGDGTTITLSTGSRGDTGHTLFHANSGGFLACASCHAEGNEDGRTWNFSCEGPRRTQSLQTGLAGTEPFHWDGTEGDFNHLMIDVFQGRMSGPTLTSDQGAALLSWLDRQPRAPRPQSEDMAAVGRGQALFQDPMHGCATCHTGPHMTNNLTVDVGTGGMFQVPSLIGVGSRGPYMHNGCAPTLEDRFGPCGGGDSHGFTSTLSPDDVSDLVAYLKTL